MPSGLIDEEDGVGSWRNRLGDFGQMQVHRFGVTGGQDQSRALSLLWADGSEDVGRGGALIPWSAWASAALSPQKETVDNAVYRTPEEIRNALLAKGIPPRKVDMIMGRDLTVIDGAFKRVDSDEPA